MPMPLIRSAQTPAAINTRRISRWQRACREELEALLAQSDADARIRQRNGERATFEPFSGAPSGTGASARRRSSRH
jgi:hypothetical protein